MKQTKTRKNKIKKLKGRTINLDEKIIAKFMKLNQKAVALALAIVSGLLSFICVIFIKLIPAQTMDFFGWLIHVNKLADLIGPREVTLGVSIAGIIVFSVAAYILGWLFAVLYNKFAEKQP